MKIMLRAFLLAFAMVMIFAVWTDHRGVIVAVWVFTLLIGVWLAKKEFDQ